MKSFSIHTNVKLVNNYLNLQKMSSNNVLLCIKCLVILACTIMQKMSRNVHVNININMYYYKLCYVFWKIIIEEEAMTYLQIKINVNWKDCLSTTKLPLCSRSQQTKFKSNFKLLNWIPNYIISRYVTAFSELGWLLLKL